jgi:hypothetical protein
MKPALRCSELDRILACPGSLTLNAIVAKRQGDEGDMGTFLHWLAHSKLKLESGARGHIGEQPAMPPGIELNAWIADFYVRTVRELIPAHWSLESELDLAHDFTRFTLTGHPDDVGINMDVTEAIVTDLKSGYDPVDPADENEQVLGYAVLLKTAYPTLRRITGYIVQPRNDEDEGFARVSPPMVLEGDELEAAVAGFERRVNAALDRPMELESSKKACRWCSVGIQCPALQKELQLMKHTLTPAELARIKATPDDGLLGDWVIQARTLRQPTEDAEEMLKERVSANGYVDAGVGTRITMKIQGGSYEFPDKPAFYAKLSELVPDAEERAKVLKFSMTEAKNVIADTRGIPKTSRNGVSGQSVVDAELRPLVIQGERRVLQFQ